MRTTLPEPLSLPWEIKAVPSAQSGSNTLADGRRRYWITEDLTGITPEMLVWWFSHLEGDMEIEGRRLPRYRVWHPFDHVYVRYRRRAPDGSIGPGAQGENLEYLGRNPRYKLHGVGTIEKLDLEGFIINVFVQGFHLARMKHTFEQIPNGTHFEHILLVPGKPMSFVGNLAAQLLLSPAKREAWLKHAAEEMGSLEHFLPQLYEREASRQDHIAPRANGV